MRSFEYQIVLRGTGNAPGPQEPDKLLVDTISVMAKDEAEVQKTALAVFFRDPQNTGVDATRVEVLVRPFCR